MSFNKRTLLVKNDNGKVQTIAIKDGKSVLELLLDANIKINSSCGGQASCGTCKVRLSEASDNEHPMNTLEAEHFESRTRASQMRLSCQLFPNRDLAIEIPNQILPK